MYEDNEAQDAGDLCTGSNQLPGPASRRDNCPYLSLLINEVFANELKNKVCILEMEMFKENDWMEDITLTICSVFMCSAFIFY